MYSAEDGNNITLTIDEVIQHSLEKNLETAVSAYDVRNRAAGIVMDVNTGEILAMASKNDFDPNTPLEMFDEDTAAYIESITDETAVSYTHLDVYKRQMTDSSGRRSSLRLMPLRSN